MIVRDLNHVAEAQDLLIEQFKDKPNIEALLAIYIGQVQSVENSLCDLADQQNLEQASGKYLDLIGDIEGVSRGGQSDPDYKVTLQRAIAVRANGATLNEIIGYTGLLFPTDYVKLVIGISQNHLSAAAATQALILLKSVVAAGVVTVVVNPSSDLAHAWVVGGSGNQSVGHGIVAGIAGE